ncbi:MAG: hypothetical protein EOO07_09030 [Chitinophagaceae bacterium]|nr:MAG: hypothetical protein EOO07_09030 [Chitinophagaceae bacterium]
MISIIICHRKRDLLEGIKVSIEKTIGVPYQLIVIDNTTNKYTILSAYNEGVRRAIYDIVCFTHEDVLFYSSDWGKNVIQHFKDPGIGMIGVAGGMAQSSVPSAWWYNNYFSHSARNLLMRKTTGNSYQLYHHYSNPLNSEGKVEVVIIDGLWFCIRKSLFEKISFDEKTYKGFHLYDADISLQVKQHAKNYVVFDILLEHLWSGTISGDYYTEVIKFVNKWAEKLPIVSDHVDPKYLDKYNWHALRSVILEMKASKIKEHVIEEVLSSYLPIVKENYNHKWFNSYFSLAQIIGYPSANRIYYRLEKLFGIHNAESRTVTKYGEKRSAS